MDWYGLVREPTGLASFLPPDVVTLRVQWQVPLPTNHLPGPSEVPLVWSHLRCSHALSFYTSLLLGRFCLSFCVANLACQLDNPEEGKSQLKSYWPVGMSM